MLMDEQSSVSGISSAKTTLKHFCDDTETSFCSPNKAKEGGLKWSLRRAAADEVSHNHRGIFKKCSINHLVTQLFEMEMPAPLFL